MRRLVDLIALFLLCVCYFANLGTLAGIDMLPALFFIVPIAGGYGVYGRSVERSDRRANRTFPTRAQRLFYLLAVYPVVGLVAIFLELYFVGEVHGNQFFDASHHVRIATRADVFREHAFVVFGFFGLASLFFAYPASRAIFGLDRSTQRSGTKSPI